VRGASDRGPQRPAWAAALVRWYRRHARPLPWRRSRDAYAIWVSEVMLQQTTVTVVEPYFERFLLRFPSIEALARASEEEVVALWSGLGYYSRARRLWQAARHVVKHHGGVFPRDPEAARSLPGVGRYTAGAVLSIAYDSPVAAVDGNIRRVLVRFHALAEPARRTEAALYSLAEQLLPRTGCGEWNQALMEVGATLCSVSQPSCGRCPLARRCLARKLGIQEALRSSPPRRPSKPVRIQAILILRRGRVLLCRARGDGGPLGRLWEVPHTGLDSDVEGSPVATIFQRYGLVVTPRRRLGLVRHTVTFRRLQIEVIMADLAPSSTPAVETRWWPVDSQEPLATAGIVRKILGLVPATRGRVPR
jgi:A/G-specific adenine glycosylase